MSNTMTPKLYREFLSIAGDISPQLETHMRELGPVTLPNRKHLGIAKFLARVIVGQQLSTKAARTIWSRIQLTARDAEQNIPAFFTPANSAKLRECGASGNKTRALLAINEAAQDGRIAPRRLRKMDPTARSATLLELHGVGPWTVDMASMFYFGDTDVWPAGDLAVARTFAGCLNKRQVRNTEKFVARFAPNRSYLALYMWGIVDAMP